ncbi:Transmembrane amino acid transporter protein [Novymonas esmeraldas]|uniref:Transmembrane amino acid transporter protein n=1 Tax=Novymonas esmeraldas TaxID=1808958 RepID=A0AAW0F140_9TRYP
MEQSNSRPATEVMEAETPRLAHLTTASTGLPDDGAAAAGLSQAQSPALSHCTSARSLADAAPPTTARGVLLRPQAYDLSRAHSLASVPVGGPGKGEVAESQDGRQSSASLQGSPPRRTHSFFSNALSLQSQLVTPARSAAHTPRARMAEVELATFAVVPLTPAQDASLACDAAGVPRTGVVEGGTPASASADARATDEDGTVIDVGDGGKRAADREPPHHFRRSAGEESLEFTSFGLDTSFMSGTSSTGGPNGHHYASLYGAAFHIFKGNVGAGVFLLPTYYQDSGYLLGAVIVALLGALMIDCAVSLLHVKHRIQRAEVKTYPAVVGFVLGDYFQKFVQFALIFTQFGFCIMFLQYASSMFAALFDKTWAYVAFVGISTVAVTPMTFISNKMHLLVYASMLAGAFVLAVLVGTTVVDFDNLARAGVAAGVQMAIPTSRLIVFISGHMFSLEGIGVVLPVENSVAPEKRVQFGEVLRYTLVAIVSFYIFFGVLGYVAYGNGLRTSVVLALPANTVKAILQVLLGLSLIFGFPIQYVPAIQIVDKAFGVSINNNRTKAFLLRVALNAVFGMIAAFIGGDTINIFASFLGSFAGVHLMITVPTLLALQVDHALNGDKERYSYAQYLLLSCKGPYTLARCRYFLYLLLTVVVWFGGLYYTFASVFRR